MDKYGVFFGVQAAEENYCMRKICRSDWQNLANWHAEFGTKIAAENLSLLTTEH